MKSNFLQRAITGILFVGVLVGCILYDPWTFSALFVVISALTIREFGHLINQVEGVSINKNITMLAGVYLYMAVMAFCTNLSGSKIFLPYLLLIMYLMISELYLKKENPVMNWAYSMLSQLYIALPFAMLNILSFHTSPMDTSVSYNPILPLSVFVFIWLSDTGAYCVGSLIGRHRLFERISPKKSWEGFAGGVLCAVAVGWLYGLYAGPGDTAHGLLWSGAGLVVAVAGVLGDLVESMLKRSAGLKDSGNSIPGHGGFLDRFDALILAVPFVYAYFAIFAYICVLSGGPVGAVAG